MICISIAQESRRMALVDMLNAAMMGADLLEVRLDCFEHAPDFAELLTAKRKPVIFTCRRPRDGGNWAGSEDERLMLLRQAILAKADYCEIELDAADQVRPFPPCKRVISYTNLKETPADIADVYAEMQTKKPDVIKLTCRARTPEEAWPLVQILAKPPVPTVVVGLGRPGTMLAVLGRKIGAPWTYAALERGMEAYPGQPTVRDLTEAYHYPAIDRKTQLVGVVGLDERAFVLTAALNAAFAGLDLPARCLPLQVGNPKVFRKVIDAVKLPGVALEPEAFGTVGSLADAVDDAAKSAAAGDFLAKQQDGTWLGCDLFAPAALDALADAIRRRQPDAAEPLRGRVAMVVGGDAMTRALVAGLKQRGAGVVVTDPDKEAAHRLAVKFGCRFVAWEALYTTIHDVLLVAKPAAVPGADEEPAVPEIKPGYLRAGMTVLDLSALPRASALAREAKARGCGVVDPRAVLAGYAAAVAGRLGGRDVAAGPLLDAVRAWVDDEDEG